MALSEEAILQQINVLTTKTSDNPDMIFKTTAALNKGLDPDIFSGNNTKIVNAINKLANDVNMLNTAVVNMINKTNSVLLDIYSSENAEIWEETQELMGEKTIIEGIKAILDGSIQHKILNLDIADNGKLLSITINEEGNPELKPVSMESFNVEVGAYDVAYINRDFKDITSIGEAMDVIFEQMAKPLELEWDRILNKPDIANGLVLEQDALVLMSTDNEELSSIPLMSNEDVDNLISSLD